MELICCVSSYLPTEDLGNLRRTCKTIENILFDLFAKEFFAIRQIFLHPISLLNLVEISKHPQFSKAVQKIILFDERISNHDPSSQYEVSQWLSQMHCIESGECWWLLQEALRNFPNCRTLQQRDFISPKKRCRDGSVWRSYGAKTLLRNSSNRLMIGPNNIPGIMRAFGIFRVIVGASEGAFQLESLECINRTTPWTWSELYIPDRLEEGCKTAFSKLKTLMLALPLHAGGSASNLNMQRLHHLLSILPNLEHLRINILQGNNYMAFDEVVNTIAKKPLRKLELGKMDLTLLSFKNLVEAQKKHLEDLTFFSIGLKPFADQSLPDVSDQSWKDILDLCKGFERLNCVNFITIFDSRYDRVYYADENDVHSGDWKVEAPVAGMHKKLDAARDKLVFSTGFNSVPLLDEENPDDEIDYSNSEDGEEDDSDENEN